MKRKGFTLIELMIVVAIIAILASIAIPQYKKFQLKAKTSEAKSNIGAIRSAEETYAAEHDVYRTANWTPASVPGAAATDFTGGGKSDFDKIGFTPAGKVYYQYGVGNLDDATSASWQDNIQDPGQDIEANASYNIVIEAQGDLDGDGAYGQFYASDEDPKVVDNNPGKF